MSTKGSRHTAATARPFVFLHIGDLHLDRPDMPNVADLDAILKDVNSIAPRPEDMADLVYLSGDLAEDGTVAQYAMLAQALTAHPASNLRIVAGDHDRQHGCMKAFEAFYCSVGPHAPIVNRVQLDEGTEDLQQFYYAETMAGVRCIFLDLISAGHGRKGVGLDFRLGTAQAKWFADQVRDTLDEHGKPKRPCAVFMHTYPADLTQRSEAADTAGAIWSGRVRLVEMGHTHYNEIKHDGRTHYAAARSVGQNEDGSVGYAVCAIDGDVVSWCFKPLDKAWPFVMITSPADRRVATEGLGDEEAIDVRALVLSDRTDARCRCRVDEGFWVEMERPKGEDRCHTARIPWPEGSMRLSVQAWHSRADGQEAREFDTDVIEPVGRHWQAPPRETFPGGDDNPVGPWPEKGLRGDQLGPNRRGRHW